MTVRPSRFLNEKSGWMGLSVWDLASLSYVLVFMHSALRHTGWEILSFGIVGLISFFLIQVRLRERPKAIRDCLLYLLRKGRLL